MRKIWIFSGACIGLAFIPIVEIIIVSLRPEPCMTVGYDLWFSFMWFLGFLSLAIAGYAIWLLWSIRKKATLPKTPPPMDGDYGCFTSSRCKKAGHSAVCDDWNIAIHVCRGFPQFLRLKALEAVKY